MIPNKSVGEWLTLLIVVAFILSYPWIALATIDMLLTVGAIQ